MEQVQFKDALSQASPIDHLGLVFGMLAQLIDRCAVQNDRGTLSIDPAGIAAAIEVIDFLRDQLRPNHPSAFNMAFRKFYLELSRLVSDANREGTSPKLHQARDAITKLLGPMLDHDFLRNCHDESLFEKEALIELLLRLYDSVSPTRRVTARVTFH